MLKKLTGTLLLGALLVFGAGTVLAQPVIFDFETSAGGDELFVGIEGSIIFNVDANGNNVAGLTYPFEIIFSAGNIMGAIGDATTPYGNVFPSAAATGAFESISWNTGYGLGTDPDTLLYGFIDFGGPLWNASGEVWRITFTPTGEGTIRFDSILLPPANELSAVNDLAETLPITWLGDGREITVITKPNLPPEITDCGSAAPAAVVGGQTYTADVDAVDPDDSPVTPLAYYISEVRKEGIPVATPVGMDIDADGVLTFATGLADEGNWEVDVCVTDGVPLDDDCCTLAFIVQGAAPFSVCIGSAEAYSNADVTVCITGLNLAPNPLAGGFDLLLDYDASLLTLKSVTAGQALIDEGWEYFTYRIVSDNPAKIRLIAIADMNNSNVHPSDNNPNGEIACLTFHTTNDRTLACQKAFIRFEWEDCGDNSISDATGDTLFIVGGPSTPVIYDDMSGTDFYLQTPDPFGWNATVTTDPACLGTQKQVISPFVTFCNGWIKIICPGDIDDRGDINLNGFAYEIADAVLYSNYFIFGSQVFDPLMYEAQIAASDINADGVPLTVADLVYLIRVVTGDAEPIAEDLLPKVAAVGTLEVLAAHQGANVTVQTTSDLDLGAAYFVFKYDNTEIAEVSALGRASDMTVDYSAEAGELRVLVYNIEDGAKIVAGSGEILNVSTTGAGNVKLVSVEAASFMGGSLEATVSAKMVPTAFALHQNYPNPFNPSTSMALDLPQAADYKLTVYNIAGQTVRTFAGHGEAGTVTITWDGLNNQGAQVGSGVYFYQVKVEGLFEATHKMALIK